jgi:arginine deiminase
MMVFKKNRLIWICEIFFVIFLITLFSANIYAQTAKVGQKAEWEHPKKILMHTPGDEIFMGVLHPEAALYEKPFSLKIADVEHLKYIERLRKHGAEVYRVVDVLREGTIDEQGRTTPSPELDALRKFAGEFLKFDSSAIEEPDKSRQKKYKKEILSKLTPYELIKIILQRPTIHLHQTDKNTGMSATYEVSPVMNLYFLRDQMITTAKGVVIARRIRWTILRL